MQRFHKPINDDIPASSGTDAPLAMHHTKNKRSAIAYDTARFLLPLRVMINRKPLLQEMAGKGTIHIRDDDWNGDDGFY